MPVAGCQPSDIFSAAVYRVLCFALIGIVAIPVVFGTYPPFIDYPFHLARISLLADFPTSDFVREHYEIPSLLLANLALEIVMLPLAKVMPAQIAGVVFVVLTFALLISGSAAMHRTLFGTRTLWPLVGTAFVYNWMVFYGFMNYVFGVGVLLWCLTGWLRLTARPWWMRLLLGTLFAVVLFFFHLVAFVLYAFAVAGFELQRVLSSWRAAGRLQLGAAIVGAAQFVPALVLYSVLSPTREVTTRTFLYNLPEKLASLAINLTSGNLVMDLVTAAVLLAGAVFVARFGKFEVAERFIGAFVGLFIAFLLAPRTVGRPGPAYVDVRVAMALIFTAIGATRVSFRNQTVGNIAVALFGAYLFAKVALLSVSGVQFKHLVQEHLAAFDRMESKSTLFAARQRLDDSWVRRFYIDRLESPRHVNTLAALDGEIFTPAIFTAPGGQLIRARDHFQRLKVAQGDEPVQVRDAQELRAVLDRFSTLQREAAPERAAYVLMQDRASPAIELPSHLTVVASGPGFRLVKIVDAAEGRERAD